MKRLHLLHVSNSPSKRAHVVLLFVLALGSGLLSGCKQGLQRPTPLPGQRFASFGNEAPSSFSGAVADPSWSFPRASEFLASSDEELWIITRSQHASSQARRRDDFPGTGSLMTRVTAAESEVALP